MPAPKTSRARTTRPATPKLPPVTVAKLEETGYLLERLIEERQEEYVRKGQAFREIHRAGTSRPLSAAEAAQVAVGLAEEGESRLDVAQSVQASGFTAYDQPSQFDVLVASIVGTAPALVAAARAFVALVEMSADEFESADEEDRLVEAIEELALPLRKIELSELRARLMAALSHYAAAAEVELGEVTRLPINAVWQALQGAMMHLAGDSQLSQLIGSAEPTADSPEATSSTASPGTAPQNT